MANCVNPFVRYEIELGIARYKDTFYLGNSIFWRHTEKIHPKHVFRPASVEYRSIKLMFVETILILLAVVLISVAVYVQFPSATDRVVIAQENYWSRSADSVSDSGSLWRWLAEDLVPRVFSSETSFSNISAATTPPSAWLSLGADQSLSYASSQGLFSINEVSTSWKPHSAGGDPFTEVVMLGSARLRQLRVSRDSSASFSLENEDRNMTILLGTPQQIVKTFEWQPSNVTEQGELEGTWATYPGSGYIYDMPLSLSDAKSELDSLSQWSWIDGGTRALVVELSVVNTRAGVIVDTVMLFEVKEKDVVRLTTFTTPLVVGNSDGVLSLHVLTCAAFTAYTLFMASIILLTGTDYFTYMWNIYDVAYISVYFVALGSSLSEPTTSSSILSPVFAPLYFFMPFSVYLPYVVDTRTLWGVVSVMAWLRLIKPLGLIGPFRTAVKVLERSVKRIAFFVLIPLVVVLLSLAAAFAAVFTDSHQFSSFAASFYSLVFLYTHSVDISNLDLSISPFAGILLILFLFLVVLILPGLVIGIIFATLTEYKTELEEAKKAIASDRTAQLPPGVDPEASWHRDPVLAFLYTWFHKVRGIDLILEPDEDVGLPEEQEIQLSLLPKAIQSAWKQKREELFEIIDLHASRKAERKGSRFGETLSKLFSLRSATKALRTLKPRPQSSPKRSSKEKSADTASIISRIQLQRLLDSDPKLVELLLEADGDAALVEGEPQKRIKAVEIIRRYSSRESVSTQMMLETLLSGPSSIGRDEEDSGSVRRGLIDAVGHLESSWKEDVGTLMETIAELSEDLLVIKKALEPPPLR